jgi:hypothetical protein
MHSTCNRDFVGSNPTPGLLKKRSEPLLHRIMESERIAPNSIPGVQKGPQVPYRPTSLI